MISKVDSWSIVIVGHWNSKIFTPKWVKEYLTEAENISIEVPINNLLLPPRLSFDDIYMQFDSGRLTLIPQNANPETLEQIQRVARKILDVLPHTPVSAVGINFRFQEEEPRRNKLIAAFHIADTSFLSDVGATLKETSIRRAIELNGKTINLTIILNENDEIIIDINFHCDVTKAIEAANYLEASILDYKDQAIDFIQQIYNDNEETEVA